LFLLVPPHACDHTTSFAPADCTFSTWEPGFLQENFEPALLDALPWVQLNGITTVGRDVSEQILRQRSQGVSMEQICNTRNEAVGARWVLDLASQASVRVLIMK
jgi:hypothetical protein